MPEEEFVEVVAEIESLEELEKLYDWITQEHGRIEEELGKTGLGKELFPSRGVRDLATKREREGEAMRPYRPLCVKPPPVKRAPSPRRAP